MKLIRNLDTIPRDSRVLIYGTGSAGRSLAVWLRKCRADVRLLGFIDSFGSGRCARKPVFPVDVFTARFGENDYDQILIASGANQEIAAKLDSLGIDRYVVVAVPSYLMENLLPTPWSERLTALKIKIFSLFSRKRYHLFFGEHGGKFIGNNKYFYLYLKDKIDAPVYWVAEDKDVYEELKAAGIDVLLFNAQRKWVHAPRGHFYFDNMTWQRAYPWLRYFPARIIHMSHGVGLKMTERMMIPVEFMERLTPAEVRTLDSKIFENDLLVSTSSFYAENVSAPAYNTPLERITCAGYPKNDIFYRDIEGEEIFTDTEVLSAVDDFKARSHKLIVYAPTFRDMDSRFRYADVIDYKELNSFLAARQLLLVVKGHAGLGGGDGDSRDLSHILFYRSDRDGYPLLKRADLLITDYSSIYMDFLHCRKPVVYFVYDYDEYTANHREIQFDYNDMTPGPKARDYQELTGWLSHFLIDKKDGFQEHRERILKLAFKYADGQASRRVYEDILKNLEKKLLATDYTDKH